MELSLLTAPPGNQQSLIPDGQSMVLEIVAVEAKAAQADGRSVKSLGVDREAPALTFETCGVFGK